MPVALRDDDRDLLVLARVAEPNAHRKAVELRFGKREGALLIDRILRSDDEKRELAAGA